MPKITAVAKALPRSAASGQFISQMVTPAVRAGVQAFAEVAHEESQVLVHVKTGRLKASGTESPFEQDEPGGIKIIETERSVRAEIVYTAPYASYVEWRFSFLRAGLDAARERGTQAFRDQFAAYMKG
jgi:hypothetical protein